MERICLLSGSHVASNPRLVKEADTLHSRGYPILVLGVQTVPKVSEMDAEIQSSRSWRFVNIRWGWIQRLRNRGKRARALAAVLKGDDSTDTFNQALSPWHENCLAEIQRFAPKLIIAHSLASLVIASWITEHFHIPYAFDMEDYHPAEQLEESRNQVAFRVLRACLPQAVYISAASPQIAEEASRVFGLRKVVPILNSFPLQDLPATSPRDRRPGGMSLYWFSQTLGFDRGLMDVFRACARLKGDFQLHLRGSVSSANRRHLLRLTRREGIENHVYLHSWCKCAEIFERIAEHDVGLALEMGAPFNREICITNKILHYPLAGLAVVASKTKAQAWVMAQAPEMGFVYEPGDVETLAAGLQRWMDNPVALKKARTAARQAAEEIFCWEKEAPKFLELAQKTLAEKQKTS